MPEIYATNPLMQGLKTLGDVGMENRAEKEEFRLEGRADAIANKEGLVKQFESDIAAAEDILSKTDDPTKRQAVGKVLDHMREVYTGSYAQELGQADTFARRIELAAQTPVKKTSTGSAAGSSQFERNIANLSPEEQQRIRALKAETDARGGMSPFTRTSEKGFGEDYAALMAGLVNVPSELLNLEQLYNASVKLGPNRQGFGMDYIPNLSDEAQLLDIGSIKSALDFVNKTKGAVSDKEMQLFTNASLGTGRNPEVNQSIIRGLQAALIRNQQRAEFMTEWIKTGGTYADGLKTFKQFAEDNPIFEMDGTSVKFLKDLPDVVDDRSWKSYLPNSEMGVPPMDPAALDQQTPRAPAQPPAAPMTAAPVKTVAAPAKIRKKYNISTGEFE